MALLCLAWVVLFSWFLIRGPGDHPARDTYLYLAIMVLAAGVVGFRAITTSADRGAWTLLAVGTLMTTAGDILYPATVAGSDADAFPTVADALYLAYYPFVLAAVIAYVRNRVRSVPRSVWRDAVVLSFAAGSLVGAIFLAPLTDAVSGGLAAQVVGAAYPIGDTVLLLLAGMGLVLTGTRTARALVWVSGGLTAAALADLLYWNKLAGGTYVEGTILDSLWPLSAVLTAVGVWAPSLFHPQQVPAPRGLLVVPGIGLVAATATLTIASFWRVPWIPVAMAVAALLGVLTRLNTAVKETTAMLQARREASTDDLTGLLNRRGFTTAAEHYLQRDATGQTAALLVIDLDGFKEVNDSLGHFVGDDVLAAIAGRFASATAGRGVMLGRLGGDEFAVLIPGMGRDDAESLALRLAAAAGPPIEVAGTALSLTASVGVAISPRDGRELSDLLRRADIAMYRAKAQEIDVASFDPVLDLEGEDKIQRVAEIRAGLSAGEFVLHYQPKINLHDGALQGVEALVRWNRPDGRLLTPDAFLPLARHMGLMPALTDVVIVAALAQAADWASRGAVIPIAVNVPASALVGEKFADRVGAWLVEYGLDGSMLQVEITEEALLRDARHARDVLGSLRMRGVTVSLDDYGTGYSSLNYLRELVVDEVKIDRSFVSSIHDDARSLAIVRSTIDLAHELGLTVVAEGIETEQVAATLAQLGCDTAQGFLWSRALPPEEFEGWLACSALAPDDHRTSFAPVRPLAALDDDDVAARTSREHA